MLSLHLLHLRIMWRWGQDGQSSLGSAFMEVISSKNNYLSAIFKSTPNSLHVVQGPRQC